MVSLHHQNLCKNSSPMTSILSKFGHWIFLAVTLSPRFRTPQKLAKMPLNCNFACHQKVCHHATMLLHYSVMQASSRHDKMYRVREKSRGKCFVFFTFSSIFSLSLYFFLVIDFCSILDTLTWLLLINIPISSKFSHNNHVMTYVINGPPGRDHTLSRTSLGDDKGYQLQVYLTTLHNLLQINSEFILSLTHTHSLTHAYVHTRILQNLKEIQSPIWMYS